MAFWARGRLVLLGCLLLLSACKENLYGKLTEQEAVEIMAVLIRSGIDVGRVVAKDGTNTIQVDKSRLSDAVDLLRSKQLPRQKFATMGEVFQQQGLIASPTEERARFVYALSQELSHTLSQIDGVLSARVHVVLPHNDPLRREEVPAAAAVFLRHGADAPIEEILPQIKLLVANSIQGLQYDKVTVVLLPVHLPVQAAELSPPALSVEDWAQLAPSGLLMGVGGAVIVLGGGGVVMARRRRRAATGTGLVVVDDEPRPAGRPTLAEAA